MGFAGLGRGRWEHGIRGSERRTARGLIGPLGTEDLIVVKELIIMEVGYKLGVKKRDQRGRDLGEERLLIGWCFLEER